MDEFDFNVTAAQRRSSEESDPGIQPQPSLESAAKIKVCFEEKCSFKKHSDVAKLLPEKGHFIRQ